MKDQRLPAIFRWNVQLIALIATLTVTACTTELNARRARGSNSVPITGAPYFLNFTQFEITATRRVVACSKTDGGKEIPALVIATQLEIKRKEERDPNRVYVIDFQSLQSAFKSTELKVQYYESGALKAVNASADDRTGEVIASAATTIGKVVTGLAGSALETAGEPRVCSTEVSAAVAEIDRLKELIETDSKQLEMDTAELANLTTIAEALGRARGDEDRRRHGEAIGRTFAQRRKLTDNTEKLRKELAKVSLTATRKWPADGEERETTTPLFAGLTSAQVLKWGTVDEATQAAIARETTVHARMMASSGLRGDPCPSGSLQNGTCPDDAVHGLKYRIPVPGVLQLCTTERCAVGPGEKESDVSHRNEGGLITQLGPIFAVPLKSVPFSNKSIEAAFAENGMPQTLGLVSGATAEKAASTFGTVAEQFIAARDSVITNQLERTKAETELLKAEAELAAAKKALEPPKPDSNAEATAATASFAADTALLEAELANIKAREALDAARRSPSDGN